MGFLKDFLELGQPEQEPEEQQQSADPSSRFFKIGSYYQFLIATSPGSTIVGLLVDMQIFGGAIKDSATGPFAIIEVPLFGSRRTAVRIDAYDVINEVSKEIVDGMMSEFRGGQS